jgi:dipeptidyl aminopeptidase/acylaminoacyl peptidase
MRTRFQGIGLFLLLGACLPLRAESPRNPTLEDAIKMTRIQEGVSLGGPVAAVSPDRKHFAVVVWHGDLRRNLNVYSLLLFESVDKSDHELGPGRVVATREFVGDPLELYATPFEQVIFSRDGKAIAFLSRDDRNLSQVFSVDIAGKTLRQLTHHATAVRSFVLGPQGNLVSFSAVAPAPSAAEKSNRLEEDGAFLWDENLFGHQRGLFAKAANIIRTSTYPDQIREYFRVTLGGPERIFSSIRSRPAIPLNLKDPDVANSPTKELHEEITIHHWATLTGDAQGRHVLLFPYGLTEHPMHAERWKYYHSPRMNAYARRVAAPYGLVDLVTGHIEPLVDAPHPQFELGRGGGDPVWSPDGRSVIIFTLDPIEGDEKRREQAAGQDPHWVEVDIRMRSMRPIPLPEGWQVLSWDETGGAVLILQKGNRVARIERHADGVWGSFSELGEIKGLSPRYAFATNGRITVGVTEGLNEPPELAESSLATGKTSVLTNLNPDLRAHIAGTVEEYHWSTAHDADVSGFLIKPDGFRKDVRYPLVILLDDDLLGQDGAPFLFDGVDQLNANAARTLAANGVLVLYARTPRSLSGIAQTEEEGKRMSESVEAAIHALAAAGLIDSHRVGISGWSRAAYHTDYILIHSSFSFAAASQVDGGTVEYSDGFRPFWDDELKRIRTPLLLEPHGFPSLVGMMSMADRLQALGKPNEILYIAAASHDTTRPQHRFRSLSAHLDWWRFWLQGVEDPAPEKAEQYDQWRELRKLQEQNTAATTQHKAP